MKNVLPFWLDAKHYALEAGCVRSVEPAVEITPLPKAPDVIMGIIDVHGTIVPVFDIRKRFRLPKKDLQLSDILILAESKQRIIALPADSVEPVTRYPQNIIESPEAVPGLEYVGGIVKLPEGVILIHDVDAFLSLEEEKRLGEAVENYES
ncbi:MAG: chemotaxis protein CheW [Chitinivibrionales bacterium]